MLYKKAGTIFLSIMYLMVLCLFNFSYATSGTLANIEENIYYIKNDNDSLYISNLDNYSAVVESFNGTSQQRWEFIYVSDGYYNIKECIKWQISNCT